MKSQFLPNDHAIQTFRKLKNLKQKEMDVMAYTEDFHKMSLREIHVEDEVEKIEIYINGLRFNI